MSDCAVRCDTLQLQWEGAEYNGAICYKPGVRRPLILVIPNIEGLNAFDKGQAAFLAEVGYVGLAIDLFGPYLPEDQRNFLTSPAGPPVMGQAVDAMNHWVANVGKLREVLLAWLEAGRKHCAVEPSQCAAIGYCFGGLCCLEMVRGGLPLAGVVSFHGVLQPRVFSPPGRPIDVCLPPAPTYTKGAKILIENGQDDHLVSNASMSALIAEMETAGICLTIHHHSGAGHGFALHPGRHFHSEADKSSSLHMLEFLRDLFPQVQQNIVAKNVAGTVLTQ
eukprot:TRINITY_DN20286_c0_g1_i1.p1 TRINITY_DN20286_c0_g1~~TRINITY_DN20286_c0_g1_i1.p1  ORF type:complete len:278 (-),score=25.36 TRINITY_DN20286_c0_g1_i1:371-1204(-)